MWAVCKNEELLTYLPQDPKWAVCKDDFPLYLDFLLQSVSG